MKKSHLLLLIISLMVASCGNDEERVKPRITSITQSVYASGKVRATDQYEVYAPVSGILKELRVDDGDTVMIGDTLFVIDNRVSQLNSENAALALTLSEKNASENSDLLQQLEANINITREKLVQDSILYERQKNLWSQQIGSKLELEQRKLAYDNSLAAYKTAVNRYQQTKIEVKSNLAQARNNVQLNEKLLGDHTILSELNGRIYQVNKEKGEMVTQQMPLGIIGHAGHFEVELHIDENDIVLVKTGQTVLITMDSYEGQVFNAHISRIYPILNEQTRTFKVMALFDDEPEVLYPNLTVEGNVVIQEKEGVLVIPRDYLIDQSYVLLKDGEKVAVQVGLKDFRYAEILSGIDTSQYIYKP